MKKPIFCLFTAILVCHISLAGGGWVFNKGKGFFKIGQSVIYAKDFFSSSGDIVDIETVGLYTSSFYGEYGITDRITAQAYFPFFVRSTLDKVEFNQSGTTIKRDVMNALGDASIGIKYGFMQSKSIVMSLGLSLGLPLGETMGGEGRTLQSGDGEFNQLLKVEASHSFYPKPFYVTAFTGFNNRTNGFSDEVHYGFEFGYSPTDRFTAIFKTYAINSLYNGQREGALSPSVFSNNTEFFSLGPEIVYKLRHNAGFTLAGGFALSGKRILAAPNWSAGFFISL